MPRLYDASDDLLIGEIDASDLALLHAHVGTEAGRVYDIDNDLFLALSEAKGSSALLDAIKTPLDRSGKARIRWEID